jgi:hypothetical protein
MENKNNKYLLAGLVVLLIIIAIFWYVKSNSTPVVAPTTEDVVTDSTEDVSAGSVNVTTGGVSLSYQQALLKYKDARLQLDKNCQASPDKMTFKNGAYMMVDNRSSASRTVKVGSVFPIKAYGFKIIKLSSSALPATWYVDCGSSQNVATVTIQK